MLLALAEANRQGVDQDWEFNEWLHGERGHPMGFAHQAWSAASYLYADHAVHTGKLPLFDQLLAAKPTPAVAAEVNDFFVHGAGGPV
jgi:hypothetical protein